MLADVLDRIDKRLKAVGMAESAAAVKAGLSNSAIRNLRRAVKEGREGGVSTKTLSALAPVLSTSVAWLSDGAGSETGDPGIAITDVPHISWVSAGQLVQQDAVHSFDDVPHITMVDLPEGDWIALTVEGNSMNKISPPDSIIFVNRRDKRLVSNACYVVADESGAATYKRYRPNESPPYQPASYDDVAPPKFAGAVHVIGRVKRSMIGL
jgi:SOS-response transcriptional repressor LexA